MPGQRPWGAAAASAATAAVLLVTPGCVGLEERHSGAMAAALDFERALRVRDAAAACRALGWAAAGGIRLKVYASSLGLVMGGIFLLSWIAQSISGVAAYNEVQLRQLRAPMSWYEYLCSADFWSRTLQNWQSEFLAIASMAILSIYLRQRGSPESKPVGAAHSLTGMEG